MRLAAIPESVVEWLALKCGLVPTPLADTMLALLLARTIMVATKLDLFDALAAGPLTAAEVAARCRTEQRATAKLLFALAGAGYLRAEGDQYALAPVARRWLLTSSRPSLRDAVLHRFLDAELMERCEEYVRTGVPTSFHQTMTDDQWELYVRGQRAQAALVAPEVVRRLPVPLALAGRARGRPATRGDWTMLDVGGAHGHYSVALCRRYPGLRATIFDLPKALAPAVPLLAAEGLGDRIVLRAGDALADDLGAEAYELVFVANLVHHCDEATNRDLQRRLARALRPGGVSVILDLGRGRTPDETGQIGALADLYFAVTSRSGAWSFDEMADWQRSAGLVPRRPIRLLTAPGLGLQSAVKPV